MILRQVYLAVAVVLPLAIGVLLWGQSEGVSKAPPKTNTKKSTAVKKKSSGSKAAASKSPAKKAKTSKTKKVAAPRGQMHPTPERYRQIEEALVARGYLTEEPSGKWGPNAVEALRSFQADHELPPTGRIDALSLIQLGLGPGSTEPRP